MDDYLKRRSRAVDRALEGALSRAGAARSPLGKAMRYAVFSGGKRLRPILVLEACRAVGGRERLAMPAACAVELVHAYSLVHDDLPCMDDDDFRRGRPTCHKKFGEVTALLAGDALLTLAFFVLSDPKNGIPSVRAVEAVRILAEAAGAAGMVGGQAAEFDGPSADSDPARLEYVSARKTGALLAASLRLGALLGGGTKRQIESLYRFGQTAGLLFQIVDDILDGEGYAKALGPRQARQEAETLLRRTERQLEPFGHRGRTLGRIAEFILTRNH